MKSILVLLILIFITACSSAERPKVVPDRFKDFMNQYFYGYKYEYKDISVRGNHNYGQQYALIKIYKSEISQEDMSGIYKKIIEGGWRLVETNNKTYNSFCYGNDFSLDILFPLEINEKTTTGVPINYDDINSWNIFI